MYTYSYKQDDFCWAAQKITVETREPKFQVLGIVLFKLFYLFKSIIHTEKIYFKNVRILLQKLSYPIVQEAAKNRPSFASKNEKDRISVIVKYIFKAR